MCERAERVGNGELKNNNQQVGLLADGDANANELRTEDGGRNSGTGALSGLVTETAEQGKIIIWGTDSQCDDPELAEFEMLECQELEAYLVEEKEDFVGLAERKELLGERATATKCGEDRKSTPCGGSEHESSASLVSEYRDTSKTELSSEADIFVTCPSSFSTMDTAGRTQTTDSWHHTSGPYSTISEDLTLVSQTGIMAPERDKADRSCDSSGRTTRNERDVDMNLNSTAHQQDGLPQAQVTNGVLPCRDATDKHNDQRYTEGYVVSEQKRSSVHKGSPTAKKSQQESNFKTDKSTQADDFPEVNYNPLKIATIVGQSSVEYKAMKKQNSFDKSVKKQPSFENTLKKQLSFDNTLKKQRSFENSHTSSSSSLERRKPWGSPSRSATPTSSKTTSCSPNRRPPGSPAKVQGIRSLSLERSDSLQRGSGHTVKLPAKTSLSSSIPKPVLPQQKDPEPRKCSPPQKPRNIRPKIITYVRKNPQAKSQVTDAPPDVSTLPLRATSYCSPPAHRDLKVGPQPKANPGLCSSNALFDKYRQEMQKAEYYPPDVSVTEGKTQRLGGKSGSFHEDKPKKYLQEHVSQEGASVYCSSRTLRPQLGLGVITRQPAAKTKLQQTGQRSATAPNNSAQAVRVSTQGHWDPEGDQKRSGEKYSDIPNKSALLKPGQSGLRPPGFSTVPAARLTSYGITRSSSVSSASNNQSSDSSHTDPPRPAQHPGSCSDYNLHKAPGRRSDASFAQSWSQPPNAPCLQRRGMPPQRSSPLASRREIKRDTEAVMSPKSSPKKFAVVSPKPQSSVCGQSATVHGIIRPERTQELDRVLIQQLRERCEQQALQLKNLQAHLKKANLCLDIFSITTQHFCHKSDSAIVKERELSLELAKIRDEVAFSVAHWEQLQQEKQELERRFESELQGLRAQHQRELGALEERLKGQHMAEVENLQNQQQGELDELQFKQQEQIEDMSENHEASLMEMEMTHNDTLATLQEEHARTVKNLKMAHEQQTKSLGEEFEKIRLSLQDQVDTLTFQNRCLRDRAKRFEEALRRSTDEQIVDALAPYKHIEEDLKSLKDILEMKNEQIHQQELKISELEKIAEKNVYLEERVQVLQQQNEDMKERIDKNVAVSRQLSEENANLQVHVEKESNEKKRLSRNNEELLWRLQTGELSPRMSPSSSPIHRPESGPGSPARPHSYHQ